MLVRTTLSTLFFLSLATSAHAQQRPARARPLESEAKRAGTYHLATGTWTRATRSTALAGPNQLYDNTCTVAYYTGLPEGTTLTTSGRIPDVDNGGLADCYEITRFEFGYCSFEPLVTSVEVSYFDCYSACDNVQLLTPIATFTLVNLPAGTPTGSQGCWMVTIDLANTTESFRLGGNADGQYDNAPSLDHFGWSWTQVIPTTQSDSGPMLAGDPLGVVNSSCGAVNPVGPGGAPFAVTHWNTSGQGAGTDHPGWGFTNGPGNGIGLGIDQLELDGGGLTGCYWFPWGQPGNPLAAFYHKLWGQPDVACENCAGECPTCVSEFCGGPLFHCPGGASTFVEGGCPNTAHGNRGALLGGRGLPSHTADTFFFAIANAVANRPGILIRGSAPINFPNGNAHLPDSAGLLCVAPQLRGNLFFTDATGSANQDTFQGQPFAATALPVGSTTYYQYWYRDPGNPNANPGPGAEFNFSNGSAVDWLP